MITFQPAKGQNSTMKSYAPCSPYDSERTRPRVHKETDNEAQAQDQIY